MPSMDTLYKSISHLSIILLRYSQKEERLTGKEVAAMLSLFAVALVVMLLAAASLFIIRA